MIRSCAVHLCLSVLLLALGCTSSALPLQERGELQGTLYVLGSDPFSRLALGIDDRNHVVLECSPEVEKYLRRHQGKHVKLTYDGIARIPEGRAVRVTAAELTEK